MKSPTSFALIREGTSDEGLLPHLRELLVRAGLAEVVGSVRDYRGTTEERLRQLQAEEAPVDLAFVHWDSDGNSADPRRTEVAQAVAIVNSLHAVVVPVIPIQEIEAWLLLDEHEIRRVVGKPSGNRPLGLPKLSNIEKTSSPKEVLAQALLTASETSGRRLKEERKRFAARRRVLLERLDIDGPIRNLSAWRALENDIQQAVNRVL